MTQNSNAPFSAVNGETDYFAHDPGDTLYHGAAPVVSCEIAHLLKWRGRPPCVGLALSGGGIRSASFSLGVLQALANSRSLPEIDYLSTVSGGGYIGASMSYLMHDGVRERFAASSSSQSKFDASREYFPYISFPMADAPLPAKGESNVEREKGRLLRHLRQHGNYLVPGQWITHLSLAGVVIRNLLVSLAVHAALLFILLEPLIAFDLLSAKPARNAGLLAAGVSFVVLVVVSLLFVVRTNRFYALEAENPDVPYRIRHAMDVATTGILGFTLLALVVGLLPIICNLLVEVMHWFQQGWSSYLLAALIVLGGSLVLRGAGRGVEQNRDGVSNLVMIYGGASILLLAFAVGVYGASTSLGNAVDHGWVATRAVFVVCAFAVLLVLGWCPDANYVSLHRYYRDRLMELFLPDPDWIKASISPEKVVKSRQNPGDTVMLADVCGVRSMKQHDMDIDLKYDPREVNFVAEEKKKLRGPYHIINANVVLVSSDHPRYRGRGGDNFILSPLFCGSRASGWKRTSDTPGEGLSLATAMAISGAAINANAGPGGEGATRHPLISVLMGMANLRLGYWINNPGPASSRWYARLWAKQKRPNILSPGLFETFARRNLRETSHHLLLTDGGHFENLGLYELVRRRLKLIIACDATSDPESKFADLANVIEKVRADFGAIIVIRSEDLAALVPRRREPAGDAPGVKTADKGYLIAQIKYSKTLATTPAESNEEGTLIYIKATLLGQLFGDLHGYHRENPAFPYQSTADQFFDEKQFESYRELGFQLAWFMLCDLRKQKTHGSDQRAHAAALWLGR